MGKGLNLFLKRGVFFALASVAIALVSAQAQAQVTEYTDASSFAAVATESVDYNFEGIAPIGSYIYSVTGFTAGGVSFLASSSGSASFVIDGTTGYGNYGASFFSGQSSDTPNGNVVTITTPGVTAFGFNYGSYVNAGDPFSVAINGGPAYTLNLPDTLSTTGFVGFVSSDLINSITINNYTPRLNNSFDITRFSVQTAAPVPEPETYAMMMAGLSLLAVVTRRRKAKHQ